MSLIDKATKMDCTELKKLVTEHPELPLLVFASNDLDGDYEYSQTRAYVCIDNLTLYHDLWIDEEELEERLLDSLCDEDEYKELSDKEFHKAVKDIVNETEFIEAICVFAN